MCVYTSINSCKERESGLVYIKGQGRLAGMSPKSSLPEKVFKTRDLQLLCFLHFLWDLSQVIGSTPRAAPSPFYIRISLWPIIDQKRSGDPNPQYFSKSTAVQMGCVLPYKWEAYCSTNGRRIAVFPSLRSLEARKVRRYKWGAYCRTNGRCTAVLFRQVVGVGVSKKLPNRVPQGTAPRGWQIYFNDLERSLGKGMRRSRNQWRETPFHWMSERHSVSEGFGKEFYREGNSVKRSGNSVRKIVQNAVFMGNVMTTKILKVNILLSRNFVVMAEAPTCALFCAHLRSLACFCVWPRSSLRFSLDPFCKAPTWAFSTLRLAALWREPHEAPLR